MEEDISIGRNRPIVVLANRPEVDMRQDGKRKARGAVHRSDKVPLTMAPYGRATLSTGNNLLQAI